MGFQCNFTQDQLQAIIPNNSHLEHWFEALSAILPDYEIDTPKRVAAFLAQCAHESGGFNAIQENLNYRPETLMKLFGHHFPGGLTEAQHYCSQPNKQEVIANRIYASRMGNGPESSGDGWRFCGRGLIQLTGRSNYTRFAESIDTPVEQVTEFLQTFEGCVQSACWFWEANNLNDLADAGDIRTMTKKINGGFLGLDDRIHHYQHALQVFGVA
jgi:putative chitinase